MFCKSCGLKINETDHFCGACGNPLDVSFNESENKTSSLEVLSQISLEKEVEKDSNGTLSDSEVLQYLLLINMAKKASHKLIWTGMLWIVGGIVLTILTGGLLIFWGAPLYGIYQVLRGIYYSVKPEKLLIKASEATPVN